MKKNKSGIRMIISAVIWGTVLIACTMVLKGTPYKEKINYIITMGILFHLMFIWAPIGKEIRKNNPL
jgi:hypothetical protein